MPGFAKEMLDDPIEGLNFKGFLVGDGWTGCPPIEGKPADYCVDLDNVGIFSCESVVVCFFSVLVAVATVPSFFRSPLTTTHINFIHNRSQHELWTILRPRILPWYDLFVERGVLVTPWVR